MKAERALRFSSLVLMWRDLGGDCICFHLLVALYAHIQVYTAYDFEIMKVGLAYSSVGAATDDGQSFTSPAPTGKELSR